LSTTKPRGQPCIAWFAASAQLSAMFSLGSLFSPFRFLYRLWSDQTRIRPVPPIAEGCDASTYPIPGSTELSGLLMFGLTTASGARVEIQAVELHFRSPLQLTDPGDKGFFATKITTSEDFPFMISWSGAAEVRKGLTQIFGVMAKFPPTAETCDLLLRVRARSLRESIDGFAIPGRSRNSSFKISARVVQSGYLGVQIPPKASLTSPQPYLIERPFNVMVEQGAVGSVNVHMVNKDGTTSSVSHEVRG